MFSHCFIVFAEEPVGALLMFSRDRGEGAGRPRVGALENVG